jgi:hypothetical protein
LVRTSEVSKNKTQVDISTDKSITEVTRLSVYPNPFVDVLTVQFTVTQPSKVVTQVHNLQGKLMYTMPEKLLQAGEYTLPLRTMLPAGTYIVSVKIGTELLSNKIVKL